VQKETVEVRWFFSTPPLTADQLFGQAIEPSERTDWYAFPCHKYNGVKFREGCLEMKLLIRDLGVQQWQQVTGQSESWKKWSVTYRDGAPPSEATLQATGWIAVQKRRHWQVLRIDGDNLRWIDERTPNGCEVEWTVLSAAEQTWWTVGFEAVGPSEDLADNLRQAVVHVLGGQTDPAPFCESNSYSYPTWLWHLKTGGGMLRGV